MLTGFQCETITFTFEGAILCPDCAVVATSPATVSKAELGLHDGNDLAALSRYSLDEYTGELTWEYATERVQERLGNRFPELFDRLVDREADRSPHVETCGHCYIEID